MPMHIDKAIVPKTNHRPITGLRRVLLVLLVLLALPPMANAQFTYATNGDNTIIITGYTGPGGVVVIPDTINDRPVTIIGDSAFVGSTNLASVTIGNRITAIEFSAFYGC